ncbi:MAG: carboxypeptidase regulatory-like domain-containing protein [Gemmatimonadales bacterium]
MHRLSLRAMVSGHVPLLYVVACLMAAAPGFVPAALAQQGTSAILGRVVDRRSQVPIQGAVVVLAGMGTGATADSTGGFVQFGLAAGLYTLEARAIGYSMGSWTIELADADSLRYVFELDLVGFELPAVVATGQAVPADRALREFERRRAAGRGVFITPEEIAQRNPRTLDELLRNIPGVRTVCRPSGCAVRMTRSARPCRPEIFMDGLPASLAVPVNAPAGDFIAVEVYRSLSETPSEFLRADNQCGVIAIWTRTGQSPLR